MNADKPSKVLPPCPGLIPGPLTTQVSNDSFVRRYIDAHFPHLKDLARSCNRRLREQGLLEQRPIHEHRAVAMLVGTAIDYRVRGYFRSDLHQSRLVRKGLQNLQAIPEFQKIEQINSGSMWIETIENVWFRKRREKIAEKFVAAFREFIKDNRFERRRLSSRIEEKLCRYCILFGYLDFIGRAPFSNSAFEIMVRYGTPNIPKMLNRIDPKIVADVVGLSRLFYERNTKLTSSFRKVAVGGILSGSGDVGGADFDLLVDGCLMDIKATRKPVITTAHLRQLIGYWLLDYGDARRIRSIAVCLIRHGHTEYFDLQKDLLQTPQSPDKLRATFRTQLRKLKRTQKLRFT